MRCINSTLQLSLLNILTNFFFNEIGQNDNFTVNLLIIRNKSRFLVEWRVHLNVLCKKLT